MKTLSLELAKKLQEACKNKGVQLPESYFSYAFWIPGQTTTIRCTWQTESSNWKLVAYAYTLDELLEILPATIQADNEEHTVYFKSVIWGLNPDQWYVGYIYLDEYYKWFADTNPCDAAGKLLIWCIQEGYLK